MLPHDVQKMVVGMAVRFTKPRLPDQNLAWSRARTFLALGNALNAAKALGFASCPMGGFDPQESTRILEIPSPLVPGIPCPIGYAADKAMPKVRFAYEDMVSL